MKTKKFFIGQKVYCAGFSEAGRVVETECNVYPAYPIKVAFKTSEIATSILHFNNEGVRLKEQEPTLSTRPYLLEGFTQVVQEEGHFKDFVGKFVKFYHKGEFRCIGKLVSVSVGGNGIRFLCEDGFHTCDEIQPLTLEELKFLKVIK
jgi:hypothetical protein